MLLDDLPFTLDCVEDCQITGVPGSIDIERQSPWFFMTITYGPLAGKHSVPIGYTQLGWGLLFAPEGEEIPLLIAKMNKFSPPRLAGYFLLSLIISLVVGPVLHYFVGDIQMSGIIAWIFITSLTVTIFLIAANFLTATDVSPGWSFLLSVPISVVVGPVLYYLVGNDIQISGIIVWIFITSLTVTIFLLTTANFLTATDVSPYSSFFFSFLSSVPISVVVGPVLYYFVGDIKMSGTIAWILITSLTLTAYFVLRTDNSRRIYAFVYNGIEYVFTGSHGSRNQEEIERCLKNLQFR